MIIGGNVDDLTAELDNDPARDAQGQVTAAWLKNLADAGAKSQAEMLDEIGPVGDDDS